MGMMWHKTRVLITHSLDYLKHADWVVVMDGGWIAQIGTYDQLWHGELLSSMLADVGIDAADDVFDCDTDDMDTLDDWDGPIWQPSLNKQATSKAEDNHITSDDKQSNVIKLQQDEKVEVTLESFMHFLRQYHMWAWLIFSKVLLTIYNWLYTH